MAGKKNIFHFLKPYKSTFAIIKWGIAGIIIAGAASALIYYTSTKTDTDLSVKADKTSLIGNNKDSSKQQSENIVVDTKIEIANVPVFYNTIPRGPGVQEIKSILKENSDCISPIIVKDSILFSPYSPKGTGNIIEIKDNKPDDTLYFEKEHNTVWYKFIAKESGNLTFDIIPINQNDDYDFLLYRYNGKNFSSNVIEKKVKPLRTCISRNDKKLKSMTGLSLAESAKNYIHSGLGASYVKYVLANILPAS